MKEEDEAKAKKRAEQKRLSEIAANRYLQVMSNTVPDIGFFGSNISGYNLSQTQSNINIGILQPMIYRSRV